MRHATWTLQVPMNVRSQAWCSFDGKDRTELRPGDRVAIRLSKWPVPTVSSIDNEKDWFDGIKANLHWNERQLQGGAEGDGSGMA
jgi:NAD+ kinase